MRRKDSIYLKRKPIICSYCDCVENLYVIVYDYTTKGHSRIQRFRIALGMKDSITRQRGEFCSTCSLWNWSSVVSMVQLEKVEKV